MSSGEISRNSHLLITSVEQERMNALAMLRQRRAYWGIEVALHAPLDVSALEDKSRVRLRNNAQVLALMRRATMSLSNRWRRAAPTRKASLPGFFEAARPAAIELLTQAPARHGTQAFGLKRRAARVSVAGRELLRTPPHLPPAVFQSPQAGACRA